MHELVISSSYFLIVGIFSCALILDAIYDQQTPTNEVIVCPVYVNMHELANLAANKTTDRAGATAVENKVRRTQ